MRAALKAIAYIDVDVKKTYKLEREMEKISAAIRGKPLPYTIWDHCVRFAGREIPVRLFACSNKVRYSEGEEIPGRVLLFFHGGGWVTGSIESYTTVCARLAGATGCTVISVDYRLAPEHKFPAALEDCYAVAREMFAGTGPLRTDAENITIIGDSAGGNLAAALSLMARDRGEFHVPRQILIYPATASDHSEYSPFPSIRDNGTDYLLTSKRIQNVIELYRSSEEDLCNPYFAPLEAKDLSRQPRTLIISAEYCPLRDEGEYYGEMLKAAGNSVEIYRMKDAFHGYLMLPPRFVHVKRTYELINNFLETEPFSKLG